MAIAVATLTMFLRFMADPFLIAVDELICLAI
jgi:hypothetical protein